MSVAVSVARVQPSPTAVVAATTTWREFPMLWGPMLDKVWSFIRAAPTGLYEGGHNVMLYKDDRPSVEVGVQVTRPFEDSGDIRCSNLPGGLVASAKHTDPMPAIGDTHRAIVEWCAANGYRIQGQRWEIYGDPDPTGQFAVDIIWLLFEDRAQASR